MHTLIVMLKNIIMELKQINTSVVNNVNLHGYHRTWKTLNMVDRLSLLDTDEKQVDMKNKLMSMSMAIVTELIQGLKLRGLTIGPN